MNTSDTNRLLAALCYPLPVVGIALLLMESTKGNTFLRPHAIQGIALGVVLLVAINLVAILFGDVAALLNLVYLVVTLFYAVQAYQLKDFEIPVITSFCKRQGWI